MAWLQPQPTRKRPEYLCNWNRHLRCRVPLHGRGGPYILSKRSFKAAIVEHCVSAKSRFRFVFSSSSVFSRLPSDTSMPRNLALLL